jgi:hypothetical protein
MLTTGTLLLARVTLVLPLALPRGTFAMPLLLLLLTA